MFVRLAFAPLLLAQGILPAGLIANRVCFAVGRLPDFLIDIVVIVAVMVFVVLGPLLVFTRRLEAVARAGARVIAAIAADPHDALPSGAAAKFVEMGFVIVPRARSPRGSKHRSHRMQDRTTCCR